MSILTVVLLCFLAFDVGLIVVGVTRRDKSRSNYYAILAALLFLYTFGYLLEVRSATVEALIPALAVENLAIPMIGPFFLLSVLSIYYPKHIRPWMVSLALIYGFCMFCSFYFDSSSSLFYTSIELVESGPFQYAHMTYGPLFVLHQTVTLFCLVLSNALLTNQFLLAPKKLRWQIVPFFIAPLLGYLANFANLGLLLPIRVDLTPFGLTMGMGLVSLSLIRHRTMDIIPLSTSLAMASMDDAMIVLDVDWNFLSCNHSAEALFPDLDKLHEGQPVANLATWPAEIRPFCDPGQITFQRDRDGVRATYRANVSDIFDHRETLIGCSIVVRDMTDMAALMDKMESLATTDALTGILNRRQFFALVSTELARAARHGTYAELTMYDLDKFKLVNDTHGHVAGDHVLRVTTDAVRRQLRPYDIFARYGGEEFVIFTLLSGQDAPFSLAHRLRAALEGLPIEYDGATIPITASFGVVRLPPGTSYDEALRAVDSALYAAKHSGRNCVVTSLLESGQPLSL